MQRRLWKIIGYEVIGGFFSPSHESYVSSKPYYKMNSYERLELCEEKIKDCKWINIDSWESIYMNTYINFTDVINRLEMYLQKHLNSKIRVAYVFGGDNAEFMYCFENKGIGVCIERKGYSKEFNEMKNKLKGENIFFINNESLASTYSSRVVRQSKDYFYEEKNFNEDCGCYIIRDEGTIPFENFKNNVNINALEIARNNFLENLKDLFKDAFDGSISIKTIDMETQLEKAEKTLSNILTISLDTYYKGTYSLETSRLFFISDIQRNYISLIGRLGFDTIENQINNIESGSYTLVDDDSATGKTIMEIMSRLPKRITINQVYLLANMINEKIFDIVDLRDFIIGAKNGGLIVMLPNGKIVRAPYMLPYVCLKTRATIPAKKEMNFSIRLWEMNKNFYENIGGNITLKYVDNYFKDLMNYIGFNDDTLLTDICDWHIKKLKKEF